MSLTPSTTPPPSPEQSARELSDSELDAAIAERLFGWAIACAAARTGYAPPDHSARCFPDYSTDPAARDEVVEAMKARCVYFDLKWDAGSDWRARFFTGTVGMVERYADTPGRAVCLAALAALAAAPPEGGSK